MLRLSLPKYVMCTMCHSPVIDFRSQAGTDLSEPDVLSGFAVSVEFHHATSLRTQTASRPHMLGLLTMLLVEEAMHAVSNVGQPLLDALHFGKGKFPRCHLLCLWFVVDDRFVCGGQQVVNAGLWEMQTTRTPSPLCQLRHQCGAWICCQRIKLSSLPQMACGMSLATRMWSPWLTSSSRYMPYMTSVVLHEKSV